MSPIERAHTATDDMIAAALGDRWLFTFQVVERVVGKQIKSAVPNFRARLRRLEKAGRAVSEPDKMRGQERWRAV